MGQGSYDILGWGVLSPPHFDELEANDALEALVARLGLCWGSGAEPDYLVVPLAVSDPASQDEWKLPALPFWVPRAWPKRARVIDAPDELIDGLARLQGVNLALAWKVAQERYGELGLVLPEAGLILANDWD